MIDVLFTFFFSELVRSSHWGPGFLGVPRFGTRIKDYFLRDHIVSDVWYQGSTLTLVRLSGASEKNSQTSKFCQYVFDWTSDFFVTLWEMLFQNIYKARKYFAYCMSKLDRGCAEC